MKPAFILSAILFALSSFAKDKKIILHDNGRVHYEYEMEGPLLDGKFSCFYETGKLRIKGQFDRNQKTGLWRVWDEKGLLRCERNYSGNQSFVTLNEWDSTGARVSNENDRSRLVSTSCDFGDYLFSQRYMSSIVKDAPGNNQLFESNGFLDQLIRHAFNGKIIAYSNDRVENPLAPSQFGCTDCKDIVEILVKEEYYCCAATQTMNNRLTSICPVAIINGVKKELGWFAVSEIDFDLSSVAKIKDHQFFSTILQTTVDDPSFHLRAVGAKESDRLRLMLIEFEGSAILYRLDNNAVARN
ncbi:MAG: hypothetical protein ACJ75B_16655 [Flavisolibacter sp.]